MKVDKPKLYEVKRLQVWGLVMIAGIVSPALAATGPQQTLDVDGHRFAVEIARNEAQRAMGLMHREHLGSDHGMWFVFDDEQPRSVWMQNTFVPLDILYFDKARHLVAMQLNVPPCKAAPCPLYPSGKPAQYVLELPAGTVQRTGLKRGDLATLAVTNK